MGRTNAEHQAAFRLRKKRAMEDLRKEVEELRGRSMGSYVSGEAEDLRKELEETKAKLGKLGQAYKAMDVKLNAVVKERDRLKGEVEELRSMAEEPREIVGDPSDGYYNEFGIWCENH